MRRSLRVARRLLELVAAEGPEGLLGRVERRLSSDHAAIFARYPAWVRAHDAESPPRAADPPLVSIVTPVKDPPPGVLDATARSVLAQRGARFEWCVADDASERADVRATLARLAGDPRVRVVRLDSSRGISGATNAALELARGDLVAFLDHDDLLHPDALAWMQGAFADPQTGLACSDEDKLDARGQRTAPFFKPAFSADLLLAENHLAHLVVARHALVREVGGLRPDFDGAQDHDLVLRLSERARVAHVPRVLYHWRALENSTAESSVAKPWAHDAGRRAVAAALLRRGESARVEPGAFTGLHRIVRETDAPVAVVASLAGAVRSSARVVVVAPTGTTFDGGALAELASHAVRDGVALVAPRVLVGRKLSSAGLALGFGAARVAACPFRGRSARDPGYFFLARATRDVSAAGSVFAIERAKLLSLTEDPLALAEVHGGLELAVRARARGWRTLLAGEAVARARRSSEPTPADDERARRVLGAELEREPHVSPHFVRGKDRLQLPE